MIVSLYLTDSPPIAPLGTCGTPQSTTVHEIEIDLYNY